MAVVTIDEANGTSGAQVTTTNVANINYGSLDQAALTTTAAPITAGNNSFEKYNRYHVTDISTTAIINNLQVYISAGAYVTGEAIKSNLVTANYTVSAVVTAYATPVTTISTQATLAFPTASPGTANLGTGGLLTGQMTATGAVSDWLVSQLQTLTTIAPGPVNTKTLSFVRDES